MTGTVCGCLQNATNSVTRRAQRGAGGGWSAGTARSRRRLPRNDTWHTKTHPLGPCGASGPVGEDPDTPDVQADNLPNDQFPTTQHKRQRPRLQRMTSEPGVFPEARPRPEQRQASKPQPRYSQAERTAAHLH
jgi:hypothetical protein